MSRKPTPQFKAVMMGGRSGRGGLQYAIENRNHAWIAQYMSERMAKRVARLLNELVAGEPGDADRHTDQTGDPE